MEPEVIFREADSTRPSLSRRLLLGLHVTVLLVMGMFLVWDYHVAWDTLLDQKRVALEEEATTILAALEEFRDERGVGAAQAYIDQACGAMQEAASPGHHIAVRLGGKYIQALAHDPHARRRWVAILYGAQREDGVAPYGDDKIVVAKAARVGITVYVSEKLSKVEETIHAEVFRRILSILLVGLVIVLVVNIGVDRFMARPLQEMVEVVRRFGSGDREVRMPRSYPRELGILAEEFDRMAEALSQAEEERAMRMDKARRVQRNLHPDLSDVEGPEVRTLFAPADEVAGDFYDVIAGPGEQILFCMGDVTDHGVPAAMSAGMLKIALGHALQQTREPAHLLDLMNSTFARSALPEDFATVMLARWDRASDRLTYASAGHETCYLLRRNEEETEVVDLPSTGIVLGVEISAQWGEDSLHVSPGDALVLLTDGVIEARSEMGEHFGRERAQLLLKEHAAASPTQLIGEFRKALTRHRGAARQEDDITLLVARFAAQMT